MNKIHFKNPVLLLITAIIWGIAFVAQSVGMDYIGPFTFNFVRNIIGGLVLIPCIWFLRKLKERENKAVSGATAGVLSQLVKDIALVLPPVPAPQ